MSAILFSTAIGPVPITCLLTEQHTSELLITRTPIQSGANISDHAVREPKVVTLEIVDLGGAITFSALVAWQELLIPFVLVTGFRVYTNMLIRSIQAIRDRQHSTILKAIVELQEVLIAGAAFAPLSLGGSVASISLGAAGSAASLLAANPVAEAVGSAETALRVAGTAVRGDARTLSVAASAAPSLIATVL